MRLSYVLVISAVVYAVFGIAFLFAPAIVLPLYGGMSMEPLVEQIMASGFLGFAVLNWFARNVGAGEARQAIVLANIATSAINFVVSLINQLVGGPNALGWTSVAISLLGAVAFAYFQIARRSEALAT